MTSTTPLQEIDPANIGPDDLWAVWMKNRPFFQQLGAPEVEIEWVLAAPGQEGLVRIQHECGEMFVTALPLSMLRALATSLPPPPANRPRWVQVALGEGSTLILVRAPDGSIRATTNKRDIRHDDIEVVRGTRSDFEDVLRKGNHILDQKDWGEVFADVRPFVIKGEVEWLHYQRDPQGAAALAKMLKSGCDAQ